MHDHNADDAVKWWWWFFGILFGPYPKNCVYQPIKTDDAFIKEQELLIKTIISISNYELHY